MASVAAMAWPLDTVEKPTIIKNPRLAPLIEHSFNSLFVGICALYIFTVCILLMDCDNKWMSLGLIAFVTPYFGLLLHVTPLLKGVYIEKYAMAPLDANVAVAGKSPGGKV